MVCDYCKKEITRNSCDFLEQELTPFLFKRMTGLSGDNRLGNYFVCHDLSCMRSKTLQIFNEPLRPSVMFMTKDVFDDFVKSSEETQKNVELS